MAGRRINRLVVGVVFFALLTSVIQASSVSAEKDSLNCPDSVDKHKLSKFKGKVEVNPSYMTYYGYKGSRQAKCSYFLEYDDFGRAQQAAQVTVLWFEDATEVNCGDMILQGYHRWSKTNKALITQEYLVDDSLKDEVRAVADDLLAQAGARALPCVDPDAPSLNCPSQIGSYKLGEKWSGQIKRDSNDGRYRAQCGYMGNIEYEDAPDIYGLIGSARAIWVQDKDAKQLTCIRYSGQEDYVLSDKKQAFVAPSGPEDVQSEMQELAKDLLAQVEGRALFCEGEEEEEFVPSGPLNKDCSIKKDEFEQDWKKYSDLDERIPFNSRHWEAQQYYNTLEKKADLALEGFILERDMEIDRLMRDEMRKYRTAIVKNQKQNLIKAFWRLSYVTYSTIKSGKGMGESYSKIFTSAGAIPRLGNALKVVKDLTPPSPSYEATPKKFSDKVKDVGLTAALESLTASSPKDLGLAIFKEATKQAVSAPSVDITPEEIGILRLHHQQKLVLDDALQKSYKKNSIKRKRVRGIEAEIAVLDEGLAEWKDKEKGRVASMLEEDCKEQKKRQLDEKN